LNAASLRRVALVALLVAGVVAGYAMLSLAPQSPWTAAVVLGPLIAACLAWLWRGGHRLAFVAALLAGAWLAVKVVQGQLSVELLYLLQHAGVHAAMAAWFGTSLRTTPLIEQVAQRVHPMTPDMKAYAGKVTKAWVVYFVGMSVLSVALYALAPFAAWIAFATLFTPLSLVVMFVGEHWLRYRWHPEFERVTLKRAVRAWRNSP
jgi:uncharacterized membrane protein